MNFDMRADQYRKHFLEKCAYTSSFIGLLLLLSWWFGQSNFEKRSDPVGAANEERDAAIKERDDAQRAWAEMGTKHERAIETILTLQTEFSKSFKDLPWLNRRNSELAQENSVQHNEIERLKVIQQDYEELQHQVSLYGMTAKRPEHYQQAFERVQRRLEFANILLEQSQDRAKFLQERLEAEREKTNEEKRWLRAQLKKNSRSAAYRAKFRTTAESTPAWGVRCACTEPEMAYGLKDQTPRIIELEATVAARDRTISRLRASHWNVLKHDNVPASNSTKVSNSSTEYSTSDASPGSQITTTTLVHTCEHEQQCKDLGQKVAHDAKTMRQLRKECRDLTDAASYKATTDAADTDVEAKFEGKLAAKDEIVTKLREEKTTVSEALATKVKEIDDLREEKRLADGDVTTVISNLDQELSKSRKDLVDARAIAADRERESGHQKARIDELETAQSQLEDAVKRKDLEIDDLENANQKIAEQPAPESAETLQRLRTANTNLDELRRQHANCTEQSETQTTRISQLELAGRELEATSKLKDNRITSLEGQINSMERQNQSHNDAINTRDREYRSLYDHYNRMLGQQQLAETRHNEDMQALNTMRQNDNAKQLELQQLSTENNNFRGRQANCDGQIVNLTNQLREGANVFTDLQIKYNTQEKELDSAIQNARDLRSEVAKLKLVNANLEQVNLSSESDFEKYRVEGEDRARPIWQASLDREMSAQGLKLEDSERTVFKLQHQLQQARTQANPLREMNLKAREDAVKSREDALKLDTDAMDHDQPRSNADQKIKILEGKLVAANREAGDAKVRNRGIQTQLNKEKKERKEEKERHERELKKEQDDSQKRSGILKLRLEKENPLKGTVSNLQNEIARLREKLGEE